MVSMLFVPEAILAQDSVRLTELAWSLDGTRLVVTTSESVRIYNVQAETPRLLSQFDVSSAELVSSSPSGRWLAAARTTDEGGMVTVRAADTGDEIVTFKANEFAVSVIAFSPDERYLVTGGGYIPTRGGGDYRVRFWNTTDWTPLPTEYAGVGAITALAFSPDGSYWAFSSLNSSVQLIDAATNDVAASIHQSNAGQIVFADSGDSLLLGFDRSMQIWQLRSQPELHLVRQFVWSTPCVQSRWLPFGICA